MDTEFTEPVPAEDTDQDVTPNTGDDSAEDAPQPPAEADAE